MRQRSNLDIMNLPQAKKLLLELDGKAGHDREHIQLRTALAHENRITTPAPRCVIGRVI